MESFWNSFRLLEAAERRVQISYALNNHIVYTLSLCAMSFSYFCGEADARRRCRRNHRGMARDEGSRPGMDLAAHVRRHGRKGKLREMARERECRVGSDIGPGMDWVQASSESRPKS